MSIIIRYAFFMKVKSKKTILKYFFQIEEYNGKYGVLYLLNVNNILNDFKKPLFY